MMKHKGFTLMEVLVSVAIAGLVITAGFRLIAMSYKLMGELEAERELISASQEIWLKFRVDKEMSENGRDDEKNISWETQKMTVPVEEYELKFRRVKITVGEGRSTMIYVSE